MRPLLTRVREALESLYGGRLVRVLLFGSFARGRADDGSDIDVAVVLRGAVDKAREIDRMGDSIYGLCLESGELVSLLPVSEDELEGSSWPLFHHLRTDGVPI